MKLEVIVGSVFVLAVGVGFAKAGEERACVEDGIFEVKGDCEAFQICNHGESMVKKCPEGLHFNSEKKICDWPSSANCTSDVPMEESGSVNEENQEPTTTTLPPPPPPHGPGPKFAPYFDVALDGPSLYEISQKTGQKDFTLAFVLGGLKGCYPLWAGADEIETLMKRHDIRKIQQEGGQMIIATGGAVGPYLEQSCTSVDDLVKAYEMALDKVGTNHLDIDVEAPVNLDMVNKALAAVQKRRPNTTVSYTLMVQAEDYGLNPMLGVETLKSAKKNGVHVDIVNPMTMEFSGKSPDWGDSVIGAAKAVLRQMKEIWPEKSQGELKRMLGVTPMLGRNFNGKQFLPKHGRKLVKWANENHIGLLAFWSISRDSGSCAGGGISPHCSSIAQSDFEFTKIFQGFKG